MVPVNLKNLSPAELTVLVEELGWEPYRVQQIMRWLYRKRVSDIDMMTNLPLELRAHLKTVAVTSRFTPEKVMISRQDGTKKYQFRLEDGGLIESVLIPEPDHRTVCLSTQLGCGLKCRFCYTGRNGLIRNLTPAEILNQVDAVLEDSKNDSIIRNIVLMGMGEPLANYDNTLKALEIILHSSGYHYSHRRVTLSSAGLIPQLRRLGQDNPVNLAISLNAADDETRTFLMPVNRTYPLKDLVEACREYQLPNRKRVTFEYTLIAGVNDSLQDARNLARLLRSIRCKINLIPFNEHPATEFKRPKQETIDAFKGLLLDNNYTVTTRESGGRDIMAACGQLGGKTIDAATLSGKNNQGAISS
ncbi:MAG: 23S rRNA (adenine(2503)-C(2))-methyltransferase RlmN [Deltaproteobacteria bacterium]|nr:23S rRNA (adenine(2503)-C(2))-methyltransferase RlmN [Deltaproteobacteria bacterium]